MIKVQSSKQEYLNLLKNYFNGFKLQFPLYFNWHIGMRFDLQIAADDNDVYFKEVLNRANTLYKGVFNPKDKILIIIADCKRAKKRNKIRPYNYIFKQIENLNREDITYLKMKSLYSLLDSDEHHEFNVAIINSLAEQVNQIKIFKEIAHKDFSYRQSKIRGKEVFFINIEKKIIFNMYDDRGLDIIASNKESLRHLYMKHNDLILDCNRNEINNLFVFKE